MSENTLLKAIFANRLTDHGRVAAQLQETLNELEQHDLFGFMCNGENEKVFGVWRQKLHALLVSKVASARFAALWLATASVRRCGYEFLLAVVDDWSTLALAIINRTEPDNVQAAALMLVATLVERCCLWSDLRRRVTASGGEAARLVTALLLRLEAPAALKSEILPVVSNALALLLRCAPAAARHSVERLARALFALLPAASADERHHVAACLALLPASIRTSTASNAVDSVASSTANAGGEWTPNATTGDAQSMMTLRAVALAHDTLDVAFACVAEPADSARLRVDLNAVGAQRHWLPPLPATSGAAADALDRRFAGLCALLTRLLAAPVATSIAVNAAPHVALARRALPLRALVALVLRVLGVAALVDVAPRSRPDNNNDADAPTTLLARNDAALLLPKLRAEALALLSALLHAAPLHTLRHADAIGDAIIGALHVSMRGAGGESSRRGGGGGGGGGASLFAATRCAALDAAHALLVAGGAGLDVRRFVAPLAQHAVADARAAIEARVEATNDVASAADGGSIAAARRSAKGSGAYDAPTVTVATTNVVDERVQASALRILAELLRSAPLALTPAVLRACQTAVIDAATATALVGGARRAAADAAASSSSSSGATTTTTATTTTAATTLSGAAARAAAMAPHGGSARVREALCHALDAAANVSGSAARPAARVALAMAGDDGADNVRREARAAMARGVGVGAAAAASLRADRVVVNAISLCDASNTSTSSATTTTTTTTSASTTTRNVPETDNDSIAAATDASTTTTLPGALIAKATFSLAPSASAKKATSNAATTRAKATNPSTGATENERRVVATRRRPLDDDGGGNNDNNEHDTAKRMRTTSSSSTKTLVAPLSADDNNNNNNDTANEISLNSSSSSSKKSDNNHYYNNSSTKNDNDDEDASDASDDDDAALPELVLAAPDEEDVLSD